MSSFVICKKEYVKAAGIMYGIEKNRRFSHKYFLDVVRQKFNEIYIMNEKSVSAQYKEDYSPDECEYIDTFWEYAKKMQDVWLRMSADEKRNFTFKMMNFFNSVLYQIEDEEMHKAASDFFFVCVEKMFNFDADYKAVTGSINFWGKVEL